MALFFLTLCRKLKGLHCLMMMTISEIRILLERKPEILKRRLALTFKKTENEKCKLMFKGENGALLGFLKKQAVEFKFYSYERHFNK